MPATPTIVATGEPSNGRIAIEFTNTDNPDYNSLLRYEAGQPASSAEVIIAGIPIDGIAYDYNVRSGATYNYIGRAITGTTEADSTTKSASVTLANLWLHMPTTLLDDANGEDALALDNMIPASLAHARESSTLSMGGETRPDQAAGDMLERTLRELVRIKNSDSADLISLEALFNSQSTLCVRNQRGVMLFATLDDLRVRYDSTFLDVELLFDEVDYFEAVTRTVVPSTLLVTHTPDFIITHGGEFISLTV